MHVLALITNSDFEPRSKLLIHSLVALQQGSQLFPMHIYIHIYIIYIYRERYTSISMYIYMHMYRDIDIRIPSNSLMRSFYSPTQHSAG